MNIGINTLWLKHKKVGGIEAYIFNLLDGLFQVDKLNQYYLLISKENSELFRKYEKHYNFKIIIFDVDSQNVFKRLVCENIYIDKFAKKNKMDLMFNPVYSKPLLTLSKIPYVTTIHDLQALHYPEYFSKIKLYWLRYAWKNAIHSSDKIIAISEFVKKDIIEKYNVQPQKVNTIYNPIKIEKNDEDFNNISIKLNIEGDNYFYTVSSMYKHKNLKVLLEMMKKIKERDIDVPKKLVISGINGNFKDEFDEYIKKLDIEDMVIKTGFISDNDRNLLYKNCSIFLFPSIFEGFGMPPIEAMLLGKKVITTKETCMEEVTQGLAYYVNNPFDSEEWIDEIKRVLTYEQKKYDFKDYKIDKVAREYVRVFNDVFDNK